MSLDYLVIAQGGERLLSTFVSGISLGAVYALLALGFVIIFKATQVVNFAQGAIAALGAYLVAYFAVTLDVPGRWIGGPSWLSWIMAGLLAVATAAAIGMAIERVAIRPMIGEPLFSVAIITIGLEVIIRTITNDLLDNSVRTIGDPWQANAITVGNVQVFHTQIATVTVTIMCLILLAWFFRTRIGVAMRATAFDQEAAMTQGIRVGMIFAVAWGIGAALAAIGGVFSSVFPRFAGVGPLTPFVVFRAFPAVILGGLDSILGAVVGGFIIGLVEVSVGTYLSFSWLGTGFSGVAPYIVMLLVLLVRPYGLFGTPEIRRV